MSPRMVKFGAWLDTKSKYPPTANNTKAISKIILFNKDAITHNSNLFYKKFLKQSEDFGTLRDWENVWWVYIWILENFITLLSISGGISSIPI